MPLHAGDELFSGQYRIVRQIGRGGFGFVYSAEHSILRQQVAIKELIPGLVGDEAMLKRFLAEARATMRLSHDRIVRTHDVFSERNNYYIAMEFMDGGSLEARLASGIMSVEDAVRIAQEVAEGLAYADERGIVHCDLKPANILLSLDRHTRSWPISASHMCRRRRSPARGRRRRGLRPAPFRTWHQSRWRACGMIPGSTYMRWAPSCTGH